MKAEGGITHTRGEGNVKAEQRELRMLALEIGVMQPQTKECQQPPDLEEARTDSPLESWERVQFCQHLHFSSLKLILGFWYPVL